MEVRQTLFDDYGTVASAEAADTKSHLAEHVLGNSAALDQWRGLALVLVLISHGLFFTGRVAGIGRVGVNLFFFISGILVFRSLSKGKGSTSIECGYDFLKKRLIRLYPALLAYVVVIAPIAFLCQHRPGLPEGSDWNNFVKHVPSALLYGVNYVNA